jgi:hypothetical protein
MLAGRKHEVYVGARQMSVVRLNTALESGDNIAFSAGIVLELRKKLKPQKFRKLFDIVSKCKTQCKGTVFVLCIAVYFVMVH